MKPMLFQLQFLPTAIGSESPELPALFEALRKVGMQVRQDLASPALRPSTRAIVINSPAIPQSPAGSVCAYAGCRVHDGPQAARGTPMAPDHAAQVLFGDLQLQHRCPFSSKASTITSSGASTMHLGQVRHQRDHIRLGCLTLWDSPLLQSQHLGGSSGSGRSPREQRRADCAGAFSTSLRTRSTTARPWTSSSRCARASARRWRDWSADYRCLPLPPSGHRAPDPSRLPRCGRTAAYARHGAIDESSTQRMVSFPASA